MTPTRKYGLLDLLIIDDVLGGGFFASATQGGNQRQAVMLPHTFPAKSLQNQFPGVQPSVERTNRISKYFAAPSIFLGLRKLRVVKLDFL